MSARSSRKPRRRWWQIGCRIAALAVLALAAAYVSLPWWAPAELLRRRLARDLSRQAGVNVTLGKLSLSWGRGIVVEALAVPSPSDGQEPLATVGSIRADLSPIRFLLGGSLEWMELADVRLWVRLDQDGNANMAPLARLAEGPEVKRISVRRAQFLLEAPEQPRQDPGATEPARCLKLCLDVKDLQYGAGRVQRLGRLTMSAVLDPQGKPAPVSLDVAAGTGAETPADATFSFSNLDLEQLHVARLLRLPLKKLSGRCKGSLDVRVSRQGVVDDFSFDLTISKLNVHPEHGPQLREIPTAHLRIAAVCDLINRCIDIRSASVLLPGIELSGRAKVFTDVPAGQWQAVSLLDLAGVIEPAGLAALLTGEPALGEWEVLGPVGVKLLARHEGAQLQTDLSLRAGDAEIRRHGRTLKPAGRPLALELSGVLDDRTWSFNVEDSSPGKLLLGGNRLEASGNVNDLRRLAECLAARPGEGQADEALAALRQLTAAGRWQVTELQSLRDLSPPLAEALQGARLAGPVDGQWSVKPGSANLLECQAKVALPAETELAFGAFVKPRTAMELNLSASLGARRPWVSRAQAELSVGLGRLRVVAEQSPAQDAQAPAWLQLDGTIEVRQVQALLECWPRLAAQAFSAEGAAEGPCQFRWGPNGFQAGARIDLSQLALAAGDWLVKPSGQPASLSGQITSDSSFPADRRVQAICRWKSPKPDADLVLQGTWAQASDPQSGEFFATAALGDAGWLEQSCPAFRKALAGGKLGGALTMTASAAIGGEELAFRVDGDGGKLQWSSPSGRRTKLPGVPATLAAKGRILRRPDGVLHAELEDAAVSLAHSRVRLSGQADLKGPLELGPRLWPQPALEDLRASIEASCLLEEPLLAAAPELRELAQHLRLDGCLTAKANVSADAKGLRLAGKLDAADLSIGPIPTAYVNAQGRSADPLGPVGKARGSKAEIDFQATLPPDLSRLQVNEVRVDLGDVQLLADAAGAVRTGPDGLPQAATLGKAHLALTVGDASALEKLLPSLKPCRLTGRAMLETELTDVTAGKMPYVGLHCQGLKGQLRGKDVELDGELRLQDVSAAGGQLRLGGIKTDGLEFRAGRSHGWLLADLSAMPDKPIGSIRLLAETLDNKELGDLIDPSPRPVGKLSRSAIAALQQDALRRIDAIRPRLLASQLDFTLSAEHFRAYDGVVDQSYDARQVEMAVSIRQGRLEMSYAAGVNGGTVQVRHTANLAEPSVLVVSESRIRDLIASEDLQPQLSQYFPGNTVYGTFSRTQALQTPLADVVANATDVRYPLHPVGTATTVTTDGLVEGRAAPKFVTVVFPGLNLTKYRYNQMTAFARYRTDGTVENDMIFSGQVYDIYISGDTDADNYGRYDTGVILVGSPQTPEWSHRWRLGRIPILKIEAVIEGGKMHKEKVDYFRPDQTLGEIFIRNNPINRILVNSKKD